MSKLPPIKPSKLVKILEQIGFRKHRQSRGSHLVMTHIDGRRTVVPIHSGKDMPNGTLRAILRDINLSKNELAELT